MSESRLLSSARGLIALACVTGFLVSSCRAAGEASVGRVTLRFGEGETCTALGRGAHADTWVSQGFPNSTNALSGEPAGTATYLYYRYVSGLNDVLMRFELGAIPPGSRIIKATLRLFRDYTYNPESTAGLRGFSQPIFAVTDPDGTGGWTETEATWNSKRSGVPWKAGGTIVDALGPQIGSVYIKNWLSGSYARQDWYDADLTAAVQGWVDNPSSNLGFVIRNNPYFNRTFRSKENPDASLRPYLEVTFEGEPETLPPAPTDVAATYHAGQTFITWREAVTGRDETSYRVYRSTSPITSANLHEAEMLDEVYQGSSYLSDSVFGDPGYIKQPQLAPAGVTLALDSGLLVYTVERDGTAYYAVTTVVEGQENRLITPGQNATVAPTEERVAEIEPYRVNEQPGYYVGYAFFLGRKTPWNPSDEYGLDNRVGAPFLFSVTTPYNRTGAKAYPLTIYLHATNRSYFGSEEGVDNARGDTGYCLGIQDTTRVIVRNAAGELLDLGPYLETSGYGYSKYRGWNSNYTPTSIVSGFRKSLAPTRPWNEGRSVMYTEKAIRFVTEWMLRHSKWFLGGGDYGSELDPGRVYVTGGSMGGSGALHLAVHQADLVAAVNVFKGRPTALSEVFPSDNSETLGSVGENIPLPDGTPVYAYLDLASWISSHPGANIPPIRMVNGKNDTVVPWPDKPPFYAAALGDKVSLTAYWDQSEHVWDQTWQFKEFINERLFWSSQSSPGFNIFSFRKNRAFLAFSNCPLDQNPGPGPPAEGDPIGGMNRYQWWDTGAVIDTTSLFEARVFLMTQAPVQQTTTSIAVRNLQGLRHEPGTRYVWRNLTADGAEIQPPATTQADAHGRITIDGFIVSKTGSRLVITPPTTFYRDADADGWGDAAVTLEDVVAPEGYVAVSGDCDDNDPTTHPQAVEVCDGKDNDCDSAVDEDLALYIWYRDVDGDGYGEEDFTQTCSSTPPLGYTAAPGDCEDVNPAIHPNADEICDGLDNDCDGEVDEGLYAEDWVAVRPGYPNGWELTATGSSSVSIGIGPGGRDALAMTIGSLGDGEAYAGTDAFDGALLARVFRLQFDSFVTEGVAPRWPRLFIGVDRDGDDVRDDVLVYDPALQTGEEPGEASVWKTWNAFEGLWWSEASAAGMVPGRPGPLAAYIAAFPEARIRGVSGESGIRLGTGEAGAAWGGFSCSIDTVCVGVGCAATVFNFQPDPDTTPPVFRDVSLSPDTISPADGRMAPITLSYAVSDDRDASPSVLVSVSGGGPEDSEVVDPGRVRLRAAAGRDYMITLAARDAAGNVATVEMVVRVGPGTRTGPWGDVDADGWVTTLDAELVRASLMAPDTLSAALHDRIRRYGDVNGTINRTETGNGVLDSQDVSRLVLMGSGIIDAGTCGPDTPGYGDIDGDGAVTIADAVCASRARSGLLPGEVQARALLRGVGDISPTLPYVTFGDGAITDDDARVIEARAGGTEPGAPAYPDYWPLHLPTNDHPETPADATTFFDKGPLQTWIGYSTAAVEECDGLTITRVDGSDGSVAGVYKGIDGSIYVAYMEHPPTLGPRRFRFTSPFKLLDARAARGDFDTWSGRTSSWAPDFGTKPMPYRVTILRRGDVHTPAAGPYPDATPHSTWSATVSLRLDVGLLASRDSAIEMQQAFFFDLAPGIGVVGRGQASLQGSAAPTLDRPCLEAASITVRGRTYSATQP